MIQMQTKLKISDNSGAKIAKCVKVLGGFKRKFAKTGDLVVLSIQTLKNKFRETSKVKKREVYKGIIIKTKKKEKLKTGEFNQFDENSVILVNKQNLPIATRITSHLPKKLKKKKFQKFLNISLGIY